MNVCTYKGHAATASFSSQVCQYGQAMSEISDAATAVSASGVSEDAAPAGYSAEAAVMVTAIKNWSSSMHAIRCLFGKLYS